MIDQDTILRVRNLSAGRTTNVDRTEAWQGRTGLGTDWIQDNTGRVTDNSRDNTEQQNPSSNSDHDNSFTHQAALAEAVNPNNPVIVFSQTVPYYPIEYSCEHLFQLPLYEKPQASSQQRDDLFNLPQAMDTPALNATQVPLTLQFLLPRTIRGETVDANQVTKNVEALEWSLLNLMVDTTGLAKNCHLDAQFDDRLHNHGLRQRVRRDLSKESIIARRRMESLPYPTSIYKVANDRDHTQWRARCNNVKFNRASSSCFTLHTALNLKYRGSQEESNLVSDYVQNIVYNQIAVDASKLFVMDVSRIYRADQSDGLSQESDEIGQTDSNTTNPFHPTMVGDAPTDPTSTSNSIWSGLSSPQIYIPVATGIFVLLLWITMHLLTRNKRRRHGGKTASVSQASKERPNDIETGSVKTEPTISPANSGPEFSSEFGSPDPKTLPSPSTPSWVDLIGSRSIDIGTPPKPVKRSVPVSVDSPDRKPLPVSVDSPDRSAAGLPPRPPQARLPRQGSIKLKKNRKKKKKKSKKVVPLKRVNSREHINEMPMISESDEDSELGSEDGSEYNSDDGSSYDASSGCITPSGSRSLSRTSSRASSPQRSLADEEEDYDQNVEFVIEATDFPNLLDGEHEVDANVGASGKTSSGFDQEPRTTMTKSSSGDKLAQRLTKELKKLEIEPRSKDESVIEDGDSPKRRLPLPWLN